MGRFFRSLSLICLGCLISGVKFFVIIVSCTQMEAECGACIFTFQKQPEKNVVFIMPLCLKLWITQRKIV